MNSIYMRKLFFLLLAACLLLGASPVVAQADGIDITDKFTDPDFRALIYARIGKTAPEPILDTDVTGITEIYINNRGFKSLAGLPYLINMRTLSCVQNQLTELDVTGLPLRYLNVSLNYMKDTSDVKGFAGTWDGLNFIFGRQYVGVETDQCLYFSISDGLFRLGSATGAEYTGQPDAWSWDEGANTLTLNGLKWITPAATALRIGDGGELNIYIVGENRLECTSSSAISAIGTDLTFTGKGTLYALGGMGNANSGYGIYTGIRSIMIDGPTIHTQGGIYGVFCRGLTIESGALYVRSESIAIRADEIVYSIPPGTPTGSYADPIVTIAGGILVAQSAKTPLASRAVIAAQSYRWWTSNQETDPGGEGTACPPTAYKYGSLNRFVKIDATNEEQVTTIKIDAAAVVNVMRGGTYKFESPLLGGGARSGGAVWMVSNPSFAAVDDEGTVNIFNKAGTVVLIVSDPASGQNQSVVLRIV